MNVLINALGAAKGGAVRHLTSFLPALSRIPAGHDYTVLVRDSCPIPEIGIPIRIVRVPDGAAGGPLRLWYDNVAIPRTVKAGHYEIVVSLLNFGPIRPGVPHVLFQRNANYFSDEYAANAPFQRRISASLRRKWACHLMGSATLIVTPSDTMQAAIKSALPKLQRASFRTLYHGVDPDQMDEALPKHIHDQLELRQLKLLYPATAAPHKGFEILFSALALLRDRGVDFKLFTTFERKDWPSGVDAYERQIRTLALEDYIERLGYLAPRTLGALYRSCDALVFPSLIESFGFPLIEAMSFGLPVVAADTPINREICGDAALYYPSTDPAAAAERMVHLAQTEERTRLATACKEQFQTKDWSWDRYAREFSTLLAQAAAAIC